MSEELTNKEVGEKLKKINKILKEDNLPEDLKDALKETEIALAVLSMNCWLPKDLGRKIIMLVILIIGISGAMAGNTRWLLILLILPFFSPKIIMKLAIIAGRLKGNK
ncbi:MAG: hypothetical protein WC472_04140 [Candidatus Paceibacterota bacterium]